MKNIKYVEDESYETKIDSAINNAVANIEMEGFKVSKEDIENLKKEFLNNEKLKLLVKKGKSKNER